MQIDRKKRESECADEIFLWDNVSPAVFKFPCYIKMDNYGGRVNYWASAEVCGETDDDRWRQKYCMHQKYFFTETQNQNKVFIQLKTKPRNKVLELHLGNLTMLLFMVLCSYTKNLTYWYPSIIFSHGDFCQNHTASQDSQGYGQYYVNCIWKFV